MTELMTALQRRKRELLEMLKRGELPDVGPVEGIGEVIAADPRTRLAMREALIAACLGDVLLITGPTGAGKSALGRWIAACLVLPFHEDVIGAENQNLIAARLFGARRGAYTDCTSTREGIFDAEGVVLVDEIGNADEVTQRALLGVAQTRTFCKMGDNPTDPKAEREVNADLVIYATHSPMGLRQDLRARLGRAVVELPALADRPQDIPPLVRRVQAGACLPFAEGVADHCARLDWPGNLRSLINVVKASVRKAFVRGADVVEPQDIDAARASVISLVAEPTVTPPAEAPVSLHREAPGPPLPREDAAALATERTRPVRPSLLPAYLAAWRLTQEAGAFKRRGMERALGVARSAAGRALKSLLEAGVIEAVGACRYRWRDDVAPPIGAGKMAA